MLSAHRQAACTTGRCPPALSKALQQGPVLGSVQRPMCLTQLIPEVSYGDLRQSRTSTTVCSAIPARLGGRQHDPSACSTSCAGSQPWIHAPMHTTRLNCSAHIVYGSFSRCTNHCSVVRQSSASPDGIAPGAITQEAEVSRMDVRSMEATSSTSTSTSASTSSSWTSMASSSSINRRLPIKAISLKIDADLAELCVETCSEALQDDPSTMYFCRPGQGLGFYRCVLQGMLHSYPTRKLLFSIGDADCVAFAYIYPLGKESGSVWERLGRMGLGPLWHIRLDRLASGFAASDFYGGERDAFLKEHGAYLYITVLGTKPQLQRRGMGTHLMSALLAAADTLGVPTYIEATTPQNARLYEGLGFQTRKEWRPHPSEPWSYTMSRMAACTARAARRRQHLIALGMLQPNADDQSGAMSSGHVGTAVKAKHRSLLRAKVGMSGVAIPAAFAAEEGPSGQPRMQAVDEPAGLPGPANSQTDAIAVGNNYAGISVSSSNSMGLLPQFACVDDFMDLLPLSTLPDLVEAYTVD